MPLLSETLSVLSVSPEFLGVSSFPVSADGGSEFSGGSSSSVKTSSFLTGGGKTTELSVCVLGSNNPVNSGVTSDAFVAWVDHDDFVEFEGSILSNPVGVENTEVGALAANSFFSSRFVGSFFLQFADTLVNRFSMNDTFTDESLTSSTSDTDSVDNVSLSSFVSELSCLFRAGRSLAFHDDG